MNKKGLIAPHAHFTLLYPLDTEKIRIDQYLAKEFSLYSRSFFKKLIDEGLIQINNTIITKQSTHVLPQDIIDVHFPGKREITQEVIQKRNIAVEIIYEHEHFFIISKPAGLIVHPPHSNSTAVTLMDWLLVHYQNLKDIGYVDRPGIVHRLDKETSGLMIIPRTNSAHTLFNDMFKNRTIKKTYLAVVHGHPERVGTITYPIGRDPVHKIKMYAYPDKDYSIERRPPKTRSATTHYTVKDYFNDSSLIEVKPITGRTHQIRVHFAALGHSLVGDPVYGVKSKKIKRHALHAHALSFTFMNTPYTFSIDAPSDIQKLIAQEKAISDYCK